MSCRIDSTRSVGQPLPIDNDTAEEREVALRMQGQESFLTSSTEEYASCFHTFINALRDNTFDKLVLSRHLTIDKVSGFLLCLYFVQRAGVIFIHIYTCATLRRRVSGWKHLKSFYQVKRRMAYGCVSRNAAFTRWQTAASVG